MTSISKKITANGRFLTHCSLLFVVFLVLPGCSKSILVLPPDDVTTQTTPYIHAGPLHLLLKMPTGLDKVKVLIDKTGLAHIFIASVRTNEVHRVVLAPDGVIERELIKSNVDTLNLDVAFDRSGQLHVLIGEEHLIKQDGTWVTWERTPWKETGLKIKKPGFVAGARDLTWAFLISGEEVGTPGRWDWFGVAGGLPPMGLIVPWHTQADKLMIVPEMAPTYTLWMVVEPESTRDTWFWAFGVDRQGAIQVVYEQANFLFMPIAGVYYQKVVIEPDPSATPMASSDVTAPLRDRRQLLAIPEGQLVGPTDISGPPVSIAVDPDSGAALVVMRVDRSGYVVRDQKFSASIRLPVSAIMKSSIASAGKERFHAVVVGQHTNFWTGDYRPVYYLSFSGSVWSRPVALGIAKSSHWFFKDVKPSVEVASSDSRRAVVVWPTDEGIVGRWIELLQ